MRATTPGTGARLTGGGTELRRRVACAQVAEYGGEIGRIVDKLDKGSADGAGLDEGQDIGTLPRDLQTN